MERKELISKIYKVVNKQFNEYKEKVVVEDMEDYCEEMALMYDFKKYLQYIETEEKDFTNAELQQITDNDLDIFINTFMEIFWNSDLGNSYTDIKSIMKESIKEILQNK